MPIIGFVGLPGAGKTYALTRQAYRTRQRYPERVLISNYPIYLPGRPVLYTDSIEDLFELRDADIYLDEAHLWLNSRNWKRNGDRVTEFLSQLRHAKLNLWYTTQSITSVDKLLRDRTQETYWFESFRKLGFFYWASYNGIKRSKQDLIVKGWFFFSRKVAACYDTLFMVRV